jgi:CheY-like chemotaxis protein
MSKSLFLYVEDDALSREIMQMIVENAMGQSVVIFEDSQQFMERVKALPQTPDAFLLDIHVTPHDGFEMLQLLRDDPQTKGVPVIALTASVMNEEVDRLRASGFDGAVGKPLSIQTFPALIQRILDGEMIWHIV